MKHVLIYTDGACSGNPGRGGFGAILIYGSHKKEISKGFKLTTNNRMELMAVICALEALKEPCHVTLYSDSKYVVDALSLGWVYKWQKNGWMRTKTERAQNQDLWERLLEAAKPHQVEYEWVRGHSGNELNERCDRLAVDALSSDNLEDDPGYHGS